MRQWTSRWLLEISAPLLAAMVMAWSTPTMAEPSLLGATSMTQLGMNAEHNQVVTQGINATFTADWTLKGPAIMDPAVIDGVLYGDSIGHPFESVAVNPVNGHVLWTRQFANAAMNSPIFDHGVIYYGLGNHRFAKVPVVSHPDIRGTGLNEIVALNAQTGVVNWVYQTTGEDMPTFVLADHGLFVANGSDHVVELAPRTGHVIHALSIPSYVSMASPVLIGHRMYFGGAFPFDMYAVELTPLKVAWQTPTHAIAGLDDTPPVANRQDVYTQIVNDNQGHIASEMVAFNEQTGQLVWHTRLGVGTRPSFASGPQFESGVPLLSGNTIYVDSSISDAVYALNATTGHVEWSNSLNHQRIAQAPVLADGWLLVGDDAGTLFALNPGTGQIVHQTHFPGGGFMPGVPFGDGQTLFVSTRRGMLFARPLVDLVGSHSHAPLPS